MGGLRSLGILSWGLAATRCSRYHTGGHIVIDATRPLSLGRVADMDDQRRAQLVDLHADYVAILHGPDLLVVDSSRHHIPNLEGRQLGHL